MQLIPHSLLRATRLVSLGALLSSCGGASDSALFAGGGSTGGGSTADGGASGSGGAAPGAGGASVSGGTTSSGATGGQTSSNGGTGTSACGDAMKPCGTNGECVAADPSVGCGEPGCGTCLSPPNGNPVCTAGACSFECDEGFVATPAGCAASGDAGTSGGGSGAGGASGSGGGNGSGGGLIGALTDCPKTQPSTAQICLKVAFNCPYGTVKCSCLAAAMLPIWACGN